MTSGYQSQNNKKTILGISLLIMGLLLFIVTAPVKAGAGGLWGYLSASDSVYECGSVRSHTRSYFNSGIISTHEPMAITYCNQGGYTIDHVKLKIWRKDNGNWALVYEDKVNSNFDREYGVYWKGTALQRRETYKFKVIYKISAGEKKSCTKVVENPTNGILWQVYSAGGTLTQNKCRQYRFDD